MPTDEERLVLRLEAQVSKFERQLKKANGTANRQAGRIEKRFERMNSNLNRSFKNALRGAVPAIAVGALVGQFTQLTDAAKRVENALKVTGLEGKALEAVYDNLFASAQKNYVPLEALVELYSKAALVQKELGVSTQELTEFTDNVALALRVSGKSASESSGALLQLSQALGSGVVRAEEFNSILEGAPTIALAVAAGLEEAGGSVAKLRGLVIDGKISSEAFFRAFEAGAPSLASKVANAEVTTSQALERLRNELIKSIGKFDKTTGASASFVQGLEHVTASIGPFSEFAGQLVNQLSIIGQKFNEVRDTALNFATSLGAATGLDAVGDFVANSSAGKFLGIKSTRGEARKRRAIIGATSSTGFGPDNREFSGKGVSGPDEIRFSGPVSVNIGDKPKAEITPVSLKNFAAPDGDKKKKKKKVGKPKKERENEFQREVQQIQKRTELIKAETAAQAGLNPLIDDYGFTVEKARKVQELLTAAKEAGLKITPELKAKIEGLAAAYAKASSDALVLSESQEKLREKAQEFSDLGKNVTKGFISDLRSGKSAAEAFGGALEKIADKLIDMAVNNLFDNALGGGGSAGGAGGLFGSIGKIFGFKDGGIAANGKPMKQFARGGVSKTAAIFGEAGPEAAVPLPDGRTIPVTLSSPPVPSIQPNSAMGGEIVHRVIVDVNDERFNAYTDDRAQGVVKQASPAIVQGAIKQVNKSMPSLIGNYQKRSA